jgi:hypothetical protein
VRELTDATLELGLKLPVRILPHERGTQGDYWGVRGGAHVISIKKNALPCALWHELAHALQCERDFAGDSKAWIEEYRRQAVESFRAHGIKVKRTMKLWSMVPLMDKEAERTGVSRHDTRAFRAYEAIPYEVEARTFERDEPLEYTL